IVYGMPPHQRPFATFPVALQAIIINPQEEILLLASPTREPSGWQLISGGMEAEETILAGTLREVGEEVGDGVRVRPLGIVHTHTFTYDANISHMISVYYLMAYEGGEIIPGDDMAGSDWRWWSVDTLLASGEPVHPSTNYPWLLHRAVELYRLWHNHPDDEIELQISLT
ncbi:MAG: NUDIX hydrolase, partial [Chloroflexi bacterium]|nr:NUDIX hydrolase [Chloroflexota bacterium]